MSDVLIPLIKSVTVISLAIPPEQRVTESVNDKEAVGVPSQDAQPESELSSMKILGC